MWRERIRNGFLAGAIAAAATAGALVAFGLRMGTPARPFNAIAQIAFGTGAEGVWGFDAPVTLTGIVIHVAATLLWGVVFALVASGWRGVRLWLGAALFAAIVYLLDFVLLPGRVRPAFGDMMAPGQRAFLYVTLAVALVVGMRLAFTCRAAVQ